ncbi:MAG: alpha/beta hydrolase [Halanaerobiaceae bacterium]
MFKIKDININPDSNVLSISQERFYKGSQDKAVLLIHGYTGSPSEMDYLARRINQKNDLTVYVPRLPGHGTNNKDFRQSNAKEWLRKVYDSYLDLQVKYKGVYIGGLSMGGLLALLTASRFKTEKLFLIAPALYSHSKTLNLTHFIKYFIPSIKNKLISNEYQTEEEIFLYNNYWKEHYTKQAAELHKLMRLTRKKLNNITADTLIICSPIDEQVPMKAAYRIKKEISSKNKELIILENSPHVINNGPEKEECAEHIIEFLNKSLS